MDSFFNQNFETEVYSAVVRVKTGSQSATRPDGRRPVRQLRDGSRVDIAKNPRVDASQR